MADCAGAQAAHFRTDARRLLFPRRQRRDPRIRQLPGVCARPAAHEAGAGGWWRRLRLAAQADPPVFPIPRSGAQGRDGCHRGAGCPYRLLREKGTRTHYPGNRDRTTFCGCGSRSGNRGRTGRRGSAPIHATGARAFLAGSQSGGGIGSRNGARGRGLPDAPALVAAGADQAAAGNAQGAGGLPDPRRHR